MVDKIISCCGVVCSECKYFSEDCNGCSEIKGRPFWLRYTGEDTCGIYDCCINERKLEHCGRCVHLPCERYLKDDPTKSPKENAEDRKRQLNQLKLM